MFSLLLKLFNYLNWKHLNNKIKCYMFLSILNQQQDSGVYKILTNSITCFKEHYITLST